MSTTPIDSLLSIMSRLRDPETGCPWDIKQDFDSIAPYTIEEAFEVAEAIAASESLLEDRLPALNKALGDKKDIQLLEREAWNEKNGMGLATPTVNKAWLVNGAHIYH